MFRVDQNGAGLAKIAQASPELPRAHFANTHEVKADDAALNLTIIEIYYLSTLTYSPRHYD